MDDVKLTAEKQKFLVLTEHPVWGAFVRMIDEDMKRLDNISSLVLENQNRDDLLREVEVRYHTIEYLRRYVLRAIEKSEEALAETVENKSDIVNIRN